jgi:hypothetical protein
MENQYYLLKFYIDDIEDNKNGSIVVVQPELDLLLESVYDEFTTSFGTIYKESFKFVELDEEYVNILNYLGLLDTGYGTAINEVLADLYDEIEDVEDCDMMEINNLHNDKDKGNE